MLSARTLKFQSTRPHGAGLLAVAEAEVGYHISIHPPTRGGTNGCDPARQYPRISIHPPTRGGTCAPRGSAQQHTNFNPPAHTGRDQRVKFDTKHYAISIHPPTRGGTIRPDRVNTDIRFQSTRPHGAGRDDQTADMPALEISIHPPTRGGTRCDRQDG